MKLNIPHQIVALGTGNESAGSIARALDEAAADLFRHVPLGGRLFFTAVDTGASWEAIVITPTPVTKKQAEALYDESAGS